MTWHVERGDCVQLMKAMPERSVDAVVCDPPYGLEFMGKEWDRLGDVGQASHQGFDEEKGFKGFRIASYSGSANVKCGRCRKWKWDHEGRKCECGPLAEWPNVKALEGGRMQEWHHRWAVEALRVLKPGGHLLAFGGTRTSHRLACAIEDAGFEIRDTICWLYGSGFPKSLDVGKAIDKQAEVNEETRRRISLVAEVIRRHREAAGMTRAEVSSAVVGTPSGACWNWEHHQLPSTALWEAIKHALTIPDDYDGLIQGDRAQFIAAERAVIGTNPNVERSWRSSSVSYEVNGGSADITAPATLAAERWDGWGTALKPAHEPIVVARKPLAGTVAANVLTFGTGSINIDGSRIQNGESGAGGSGEAHARACPLHPLFGLRDGDAEVALERGAIQVAHHLRPSVPGRADDRPGESSLQGTLEGEPDGLLDGAARPPEPRSPGADSRGQEGSPGASRGDSRDAGTLAVCSGARASLERRQGRQQAGESEPDGLVGAQPGTSAGAESLGGARGGEPSSARCTCQPLGRWPANVALDQQAAAMLDEQSGEGQSRVGRPRSSAAPGNGWGMTATGAEYGDSGGASRFFYIAKASRAERNAGLDGFEEQQAHIGNEQLYERSGSRESPKGDYTLRRNHHPTVKPVSLMRWLCRLVTPPDGLILDPFTGSGTTGIAAVLEGFDFAGCEQDAAYADIARARIGWWALHGHDALRIVAEQEAAEQERETIRASGQLDLLGDLNG